MSGLVTRFALRGRSSPSTDYAALISASVKATRRANRSGVIKRWTGTSEAVEKPARFAA